MYVYMYTYIYIHIHTYIYIYIYKHIHTYCADAMTPRIVPRTDSERVVCSYPT